MPHLASKRSRASIRDAKIAATSKTTSSVHSFESVVSEPPTPTWSIRGHGRYPSSNSSVSSTPPCADFLELSGSSARLSKLAEEPPEPEDDCVIVEGDSQLWTCLCDAQPCAHMTGVNQQQTPQSPLFGFSDSFFAEPESVAASRSSSLRRRRPDADTNSIAAKLTQRFPSLSRRWMQRKPTLSIATGYSTPIRGASSRSSSLSSSAVPGLDNLDGLVDPFATSPIDTVASVPMTAAIDIPNASATPDPIDRAALASTPLLPPMIDEAQPSETPLQSPLQSPTVADSSASFSILQTPSDSPQLQAVKTPPLSSKPSIASIRKARSATLPSSDVTAFRLSEEDLNDPWRLKLGHSNFTIDPAPYIPEDFTADTVAQLFFDWERARRNFTKHQHRTGEHFGVTSKTYMLTELKWAEIDANWKQNYDLAVAEVSRNGDGTLPHTPEEPAPLMKIPSLNDPKAPGKFPTLGDEDIVGPMVQAAAPMMPMTPSRSRLRTLFKMLSDLIIPSSSSVQPGMAYSRKT